MKTHTLKRILNRTKGKQKRAKKKREKKSKSSLDRTRMPIKGLKSYMGQRHPVPHNPCNDDDLWTSTILAGTLRKFLSDRPPDLFVNDYIVSFLYSEHVLSRSWWRVTRVKEYIYLHRRMIRKLTSGPG